MKTLLKLSAPVPGVKVPPVWVKVLLKVISPLPGVKLVLPEKVNGLLKMKFTGPLVKLKTFCTSSG